jgi:serine phosphatase RsbU (regulator of sigma subunit)
VIVEPERRAQEADAIPAAALRALADAGGGLGRAKTAAEVLEALAEGLLAATGSELAIARALDPASTSLVAVGVAAESAALRAELTGSRYDSSELPLAETTALDELPPSVRRAAERARADHVVLAPAGRIGAIEVMRGRDPFTPGERALVRLAASQAVLALRAFGLDGGSKLPSGDPLAVAGDALAAGADVGRSPDQVTRLAAEATGAAGAALWLADGDDAALVASFGAVDAEALHAAAEDARRERDPVRLSRTQGGTVASLPLGEPALGVLQLVFEGTREPDDELLARLGTFGVRAAHALRAGARSETVAQELERTRALLAVVGQAIAQLSLVHTLETAVERIAELLGTDAVAVYLREDGRLSAAAGRGLAGPHVLVAERLLELALGPFRGRGMLYLEGARTDPALAGLEDAAAESGIEDAFAVPLLVHDVPIGLLAVYPQVGRALTGNESALLLALASQLAVAVQNAQLHERATRLGAELESALGAERQTARQLRALYEISRSFAQSLSLERTLETLAETAVELLGVDAAVIRMPDGRGEWLVPRALHVGDARLAAATAAILARPVPVLAPGARRLYRLAETLVLDAETARELGPPHSLLAPFLDKGSTAAILPIATPAEVIASMQILSLHPARPISADTIELALSIAGQAALALDNARLYQQQKEFADTMQRSLLPRTRPELEGLELGAVYESSARVDVGGDVYDFMELEGGRLAVILGDVTGHGIDATADMAMAKFVFRSLAREHSQPGDFLASANEVVVDEIATGKFITAAYVTLDPRRGRVACACAGHPAPRMLLPDGTVHGIEARGLALGVDGDQTYEEAEEDLAVGATVVLYTDGVVEARREGELYGIERLDALLAARRDLEPEALAQAVVADCRAFAGGELPDDCAVVAIKRT